MTQQKALVVTDDGEADLKTVESKCREERIAILAYLKWQSEYGGEVAPDEKTKQFWLDAEKEVDAEE